MAVHFPTVFYICRPLTLSKHLSILPLLGPHVLGMTPGLLGYAVDSTCAFPVLSLLYRLKLLTRKKRIREGSLCSPGVRLQPLKEQASSGFLKTGKG